MVRVCETCEHNSPGFFLDVCFTQCFGNSKWEAKKPFGEPTPPETPLSNTQKLITDICDEVKTILLEKNRKYGDSALNPKRVFSKASPIEQINVRIDDKISRIMSAQDDDTEDAELDLIGYLILKRVAKKVLHDVQ